MKNKIVMLTLVMIVVFSFFGISVSATSWTGMEIEGVYAVKPDFKVYTDFQDADGNPIIDLDIPVNDIQGLWGNEVLTTKRFQSFSSSDEGVCYLFLIDTSISLGGADFNAVKGALHDWVDNIGSNDKIVLIEFGEEVKVLLDGDESDAEIEDAITELRLHAKKTAYYQSLLTVAEMVKSETSDIPNRKVCIVVTDGYNSSKEGATEKELDKFKEANIPLYSMAVESTHKKHLESMGELSRATGGDIILFTKRGAVESFAELKERIDQCYIIEFISKDNIIDSKKHNLAINVNKGSEVIKDSREILVSIHLEDKIAPKVLSATVLNETEVEVVFDEDVLGADKLTSYIFSDEKGNKLQFSNASYEADKRYVTTLFTEQSLKNGTYRLIFTDITDISMEKNELDTKATEILVNNLTTYIRGVKDELVYYIGGGVLLFLILMILIIVFIAKSNKKRRNRTANFESTASQAEIKETNGKRGISVKAIKGNSTLVVVSDLGIGKEFIVDTSKKVRIGNSPKCGIRIDSDKIGKIACTITCDKNLLYIKSTNTKNAVYLNGKPIIEKQQLKLKDTVTISNFSIVYFR